MDDLRAGARHLLSSGFAANTKNVYSNALKHFSKFRSSYQLQQLWPVPREHWDLYLAFLFNKGLAYSTASTYISAIRTQHKLLGLPDGSTQYPFVKMMEGYRRSNTASDSRMPITYPILEVIINKLNSVCHSQYETLLFQAAFSLAFFGLFRVGELVYGSADRADAPLLMTDIIQMKHNQSFLVKLRRSKTNQNGPPVLITIDAIKTVACPVVAMQSYLSARHKLAGTQYLFCHRDGSPLTRYQFGAVLSKVVRSTMYSSERFKSHSFRIGAATWLAEKGIPYQEIKKKGRWSSDAFLRYIRL